MLISKPTDQVGRVLLTRPAQKNQELAIALAALNFKTTSCSMLEISPLATPKINQKLNQLKDNDIVIAVSAHAINFAASLVDAWPKQLNYYAIGDATANCMVQLGLSVESPPEPMTESLLTLTSLSDITGRNVLILRGVGGRETLAQQLELRGATVEYCELYQRQPVNYQSDILIDSWKKHQVKTIVVTSGEILENLLTLIGPAGKSWLINCNILVPSQRIAVMALNFGFKRCYVAGGADNKAISQTLLKIQSNINE